MSWKVVFAKEFTEVMRDKRMRFQIFISPLIITPLILAGIGTMAKREAKESQARPQSGHLPKGASSGMPVPQCSQLR